MAWVVGIGIFLLLLFMFPKQVGALVLLLVVGVGALLLYSWSQSEQAKNDRANLITRAGIDASRCPDPDFPIFVEFRNETGRTINRVSFTLEAYRPGYSSPAYSNYSTWDKILGIGTTNLACWSLASYRDTSFDKAAMNWSADISAIIFRE